MVRLLLVDYVRRAAVGHAVVAVLVAAAWIGAASGSIDTPLAMAISLTAAFAIGALEPFERLGPREVLQLPVSRRDLWRVRWLLATAVAAAMTTAAKLAAWGLSGFPPELIAVIALSTLCDLCYGGALLGLLPMLSIARRRREHRLRARLASTSFGIAALLFIGGVLWPFLLRSRLPIRWIDLSGMPGLVVAAAGALAILAFFQSPAPVARALPARPSGSATGTTAWRAAPFTPFTGIRHLFWFELARTLPLIAGVLTAVVLTGIVMSAVFPGEEITTIAGHLEFWGLLPFTVASGPFNEGSLLGVFLLGFFALSSDGFGGPGSLPMPILRHLRALPLSIARLNLLLHAVPIVGWINVWVVLLIAHGLAVGTPPVSARIELFCLFVGVDAIARAGRLRWRTDRIPWVLLVMLAGIPLGILLEGPPGPAPSQVLIALGLASFGAAIWLNVRTLTRQGAPYAPVPAASGPRTRFS